MSKPALQFLTEHGIRFRLPQSVRMAQAAKETARRLSYPVAYVISVAELRRGTQRFFVAFNGDSALDPEKVMNEIGAGDVVSIASGDAPFLPGAVTDVWWDQRIFHLPYAILAAGEQPIVVDTRDLRKIAVRVGDLACSLPRARGYSAYQVLLERGFLDRITEEATAIEALADPLVAAYCGFDPTAISLHVGSLLPIMALAHVQRAGGRAIGLVGGATGLIGDPVGKRDARKMLAAEEVERNIFGIQAQISRYLTLEGDRGTILNNAEWFSAFTMIEYLRDLGARFSVNRMMRSELYHGRLGLEDCIDKWGLLNRLREAERAGDFSAEGIWSSLTGDEPPRELEHERRRGEGLSYLEFSYQLLQAYDFVHVARAHNCRVQFGGSDQWGNIIAGRDLGKTLAAEEGVDGAARPEANLVGLTFPLLEKASGGKFGKTESGNVWLDAALTPPFEFFQFWRNCDDADVARFLGLFTFAPVEAIRSAESSLDVNTLKEVLAFSTTRLAHGLETAIDVARTARELFGGYSDEFALAAAALDVADYDEALRVCDVVERTQVPVLAFRIADLPVNGMPLVAILQQLGFCSSNADARRLIKGGGVTVDDSKITDVRAAIMKPTEGELRVRAGKKRFGVVRFV